MTGDLSLPLTSPLSLSDRDRRTGGGGWLKMKLGGNGTTSGSTGVNGNNVGGSGGAGANDGQPRFLGMPLKYISLITLAVQNAMLTIIMHYSRVSIPQSRAYSPAAAVLLNELLKGFISLAIAFCRLDSTSSVSSPSSSYSLSGIGSGNGNGNGMSNSQMDSRRSGASGRSVLVWTLMRPTAFVRRCHRLGREVFSPDCWKLSIPAILYVIQNNLQYVAASHLEAATFQVSYQMKILTTAAFSVLLLRKRLSPLKWLALLGLALGVGIVQLQSSSSSSSQHKKTSDEVDAFKGLLAVIAACFTSGLAGVYFEMVLKGSAQTDLWIRNVQLSLFSLLPALVPIFANSSHSSAPGSNSPTWFFWSLFENFGAWAWATVGIQVFGGLITAVVIKYSDNIMKGFATSLSIVISSLASVAIWDFRITPCFLIGSGMVLGATFLYNKPEVSSKDGSASMNSTTRSRCSSSDELSDSESSSSTFCKAVHISALSLASRPSSSVSVSRKGSYPGSPVEPHSPTFMQFEPDRKSARDFSAGGNGNGSGNGRSSPRVLAAAIGRLMSQRAAGANASEEVLGSANGIGRAWLSSGRSSPTSGYAAEHQQLMGESEREREMFTGSSTRNHSVVDLDAMP